MAQSAAESRKTPLHIDPFWEKPTVTPPLSWDKWTQQWKLALLAKKGIQLELLMNGLPFTATAQYNIRGACRKPYTSNRKGSESSQSSIKGKLAKSMRKDR